MKKVLIILGLLLLGYFDTIGQNMSKQDALDALKQTLQGEIIHVDEYIGDKPCMFQVVSHYPPEYVSINNIKYDFSMITIYCTVGRDGKINQSKVIDMTKYFVLYDNENMIFESKLNYINGENACENLTGVAIPFKSGSNSSQERTLKILNYLKRFAEKDPFDK